MQISESEILINRHGFASNGPGDTTVEQYGSSTIKLMTPKTKGVYMQYVKDSNDNLLIDGFFRENMPSGSLPPDINRTIAAYYVKSYSLRKLMEKLKPIRMRLCNMFRSCNKIHITKNVSFVIVTVRISEGNRKHREKKEQIHTDNMQKAMDAYILFLAMTIKDIAMIVINALYECALDTEDGESEFVNFKLIAWMYVASISHILQMLFFCLNVLGTAWGPNLSERISYECGMIFGLFNFVFLFAWTVVGFKLQQEIREKGVNHQQCGDVMLGWLILQMFPESCGCLGFAYGAYVISNFEQMHYKEDTY